jgi:hypothetical protein
LDTALEVSTEKRQFRYLDVFAGHAWHPLSWQLAQARRRPMDTLTPELKRAIEQAGDSPIRLTDPATRRDYVLVSADVYDRLLEQEDRREQEAFLRAAKKNARARLMEDA